MKLNSDKANLAVGKYAAADAMSISYCTIIGPRVPAPELGSIGVVRVGIGHNFWEWKMEVSTKAGVTYVNHPGWVRVLRRLSKPINCALTIFDRQFTAKEKVAA